MSGFHRLADRAQKIVARSALGVRLAVAVRNQCRCIIKYHLGESPDAHETGERWLLDAVASFGERYVDVGANVGDWLKLLLAASDSRPLAVLAFEPSQSAFELLRQRFGTEARIRLFDSGLGAEDGSQMFFEEGHAGKSSSFVPNFLRTEGTRHSVVVKTLDEVLADVGWDGVDLLKVDAEGYDLQVLRGAARSLSTRSINVVQFEYNRAWQLAGDTLRAAYKLLEPKGYRIFVLKRDGLYALDYERYEEYFEYTNFVAIAPQRLRLFDSRFRGKI